MVRSVEKVDPSPAQIPSPAVAESTPDTPPTDINTSTERPDNDMPAAGAECHLSPQRIHSMIGAKDPLRDRHIGSSS